MPSATSQFVRVRPHNRASVSTVVIAVSSPGRVSARQMASVSTGLLANIAMDG